VFLMEVPGDRPLLRIGELSRRLRWGAGLMAGDPVTEAGRAGWSR
jgi:hypothetical protein